MAAGEANVAASEKVTNLIHCLCVLIYKKENKDHIPVFVATSSSYNAFSGAAYSINFLSLGQLKIVY